jgi:hypothetical protein
MLNQFCLIVDFLKEKLAVKVTEFTNQVSVHIHVVISLLYALMMERGAV